MLYDCIKNPTSEVLKDWVYSTRGGASSAAFGVSEEARFYLAALIEKPTLYICANALKAKEAARELECMTGEKAVCFTAKDDVLLFKKFFNKDSLYRRITALYEMRSARFVATCPEALMQLVPENLESITIYESREYSLDELKEKLVCLGYRREEFAREVGTFALRGDILEIFPISSFTAYRFDFFGDSLESIKELDENGKTGEHIRSVTVLPTVDFCVKDGDVEVIKKRLGEGLKKFKTLSCSVRGRQISAEILSILEKGDYTSPALSFVIPLLTSQKIGIANYFKPEVIILDEPKLIKDAADSVLKENEERFASLFKAGEAFDFSVKNIKPFSDFISSIKDAVICSVQNLNSKTEFFNPIKTFRFTSSSSPRYTSNPKDLARDVLNWKKSGYKAIIECGGSDRAKRLTENLSGEGVLATESDNCFLPGAYCASGYLTRGFVLHDEKLAVIGTCDVFLSGVKEKFVKKKRNDTFTAPEVGDYAVHEVHGVGIVRGTKRISTTDGTKDYVALEYAGGDLLYVPVEQMDRLTKYLGSDQTPKLNKIGGAEFDKVKQRVKESISRMTIDLKKLYHERAAMKGFAFSPDNDLTKEFEDAFPYELTEDQAQSVAEIKKDMESEKVMDRLLLGDVGFGKTEVALRAAFKAVMDGKQVAIIAPTTILTQQHYETVIERFKDFGVRAALLNRFRTPAYIKDAVKKIAAGEIDIIIGTHRVFGKDVVFKDLGLLILDEEQCFGVEHKEKLRTLKNNVDTLTMSATPIPRTLHMSLSGIRDISLILTPPKKRIPVQSYVIEESDALIRDAVIKELSRDGQVFVLYNQVETIYKFAEKFSRLVPEAKVVVGHGQMDKDKLENHVMAFFKGEYNVLIATTIIENGIDIPNANTLIVIDADKLGLFTLYQLKGRVGRSDKTAHAYFTYKPEKVLSENSYKRLSALMEHTELGSGYKIAMRDLEIRGAGNVLGREQHGHMDKIGYELYSRLLREQLGDIEKEYEVETDIRLDAFIPNGYISVSASRLDAYKAIAEIRTEEDEVRVYNSLKDSYGAPPEEVENLMLVAKIRNLAGEAGAKEVTSTKERAVIALRDLNALRDGSINAALAEFNDRATLSFSSSPVVTLTAKGGGSKQNAVLTMEFLAFASKKRKENENK